MQETQTSLEAILTDCKVYFTILREMNTDKNLASYLRQYREKADLTQGELAEKLGISRQSVIALESGKCIPSVALAIKIAHFFEMPVEFIFRSFDVGLGSIFGQIDNDLNEEIEENQENLVEDNSKTIKRGGDMSKGLLPWSPWREMMNMREEIDRFFEEPQSVRGSSYHPSVSVRETEKELVIEADIPGVKEDDVDIEIEDNKVIIRGERKSRDESKGKDYYHIESSYGSFSRIITLPSYVDPNRADAQIRDGILEIRIPKVEGRKVKKISVKKVQDKGKAKQLKSK